MFANHHLPSPRLVVEQTLAQQEGSPIDASSYILTSQRQTSSATKSEKNKINL